MPYKDKLKQKQAQRESYLRNRDKVKEDQLSLKQRNRKFVLEYLLDHPCVDCGEDDVMCLEFDHINNKTIEINKMIRNRYSLENIQKEIEKCEVRCANCHKRKTHIGSYRDILR
jgi:hypothetical protein